MITTFTGLRKSIQGLRRTYLFDCGVVSVAIVSPSSLSAWYRCIVQIDARVIHQTLGEFLAAINGYQRYALVDVFACFQEAVMWWFPAYDTQAIVHTISLLIQFVSLSSIGDAPCQTTADIKHLPGSSSMCLFWESLLCLSFPALHPPRIGLPYLPSSVIIPICRLNSLR